MAAGARELCVSDISCYLRNHKHEYLTLNFTLLCTISSIKPLEGSGTKPSSTHPMDNTQIGLSIMTLIQIFGPLGVLLTTVCTPMENVASGCTSQATLHQIFSLFWTLEPTRIMTTEYLYMG